jgi:hypothetical protein
MPHRWPDAPTRGKNLSKTGINRGVFGHFTPPDPNRTLSACMAALLAAVQVKRLIEAAGPDGQCVQRWRILCRSPILGRFDVDRCRRFGDGDLRRMFTWQKKGLLILHRRRGNMLRLNSGRWHHREN